MAKPLRTLLIANRGEIAIRIARTARATGYEVVTAFSADDSGAPHVAAGDRAVALAGEAPAAYLAIDAIVAAAREAGCDALHPGYGFPSESAAFAQACREAGLRFVGPSAAALGSFGGMGLEGAVRLGYRRELDVIGDPVAREARYRERVAASYDRGKAISVARVLEIDAVIDPADTRAWLRRSIAYAQPGPPGRFVDAW